MRLGGALRERMRRDGCARGLADAIKWRVDSFLSPIYLTWVPPHRWPVAIVRPQVDPMLDLLKLERLLRFVEETEEVKGDVVECGVYRGGTLLAMALRLQRMQSQRIVHGFDSFRGFPTASAIDASGGKSAAPGRLGDTTVELVQAKVRRLRVEERVRLHPGFFKETLPMLPDQPLSLAHLDCDLYQSYRTALEHLWPKLSIGGVMVFDEFNDPKWPGGRQAIEEFFRGQPERPQPLAFGQGFIRKEGRGCG